MVAVLRVERSLVLSRNVPALTLLRPVRRLPVSSRFEFLSEMSAAAINVHQARLLLRFLKIDYCTQYATTGLAEQALRLK